MDFQLGKKKIEEIESLIETNCWKALFWIHSLILRQLKYLFYYKNRVGNIDKHEERWKKVEERLKYMGPAIDLCYSRSLVDAEYDDLIEFNSFRNKKMAHPSIFEYLPQDSDVKRICKLGIKIVKSLDEKVCNVFHPKKKN